MTRTKFLEVLLEEGVRFYRVNGFSLTCENVCALKGRIPLALARKIRNGTDTKDMGISFGGSDTEQPDEWATNVDLADMLSEVVHSRHTYEQKEKLYIEKRTKYIMQAEQDGKLDDIYILTVYIDTAEGLRHVIRTIRESGYINQCVLR